MTFVQESAEESADGSISDVPPEPQRDTQISSDGPHTYIPDPFVAHLPISGSLNPHDEAVSLPHVEPAISTPSIHDEHSTKATAISPGAVNDMVSPLASNTTWSPMTPSTPRSTSSSTMTSREAFLLRAYINKISHWVRRIHGSVVLLSTGGSNQYNSWISVTRDRLSTPRCLAERYMYPWF